MGSAEDTPGKITITPIYWEPPGYSLPSDYKIIVNGFISNVAAASGQSSNPFAVLTQYYYQASASSPKQYLTYSVTANDTVTDTDPFPVTGCPIDAADGYTACIDDTQLQNEILNTIETLHLPEGDANFYPVFFPEDVQTCSDSGGSDCSGTSYCGYHSYFEPAEQPIIYANLPFATVDDCASASEAPSGDQSADAIINSLAHETAESLTDWTPGSGWTDSNGYEVADECEYIFGNSLGSTNASDPYETMYDSMINGGKYWIQSLFSNADYHNGVGEFTYPGFPFSVVPGCVRQRPCRSPVY